MATIDFPVELPGPDSTSYGLQHVSPFARTQMQSGRARQRRTFTSVPSMVSLSWVLTEIQAQLFEAWFSYDITDGADWFNLELTSPMGKEVPYECRFTEMYQGPELVGVEHWRYSAEVEIRERPLLTKDFYLYSRDFVLNQSIFDLAINREWPES